MVARARPRLPERVKIDTFGVNDPVGETRREEVFLAFLTSPADGVSV